MVLRVGCGCSNIFLQRERCHKHLPPPPLPQIVQQSLIAHVRIHTCMMMTVFPRTGHPNPFHSHGCLQRQAANTVQWAFAMCSLVLHTTCVRLCLRCVTIHVRLHTGTVLSKHSDPAVRLCLPVGSGGGGGGS